MPRQTELNPWKKIPGIAGIRTIALLNSNAVTTKPLGPWQRSYTEAAFCTSEPQLIFNG